MVDENKNIRLVILEQPVAKFRFRYKSEMSVAHGSLYGERSTKIDKTFPEVELQNFNGKAVIRCSLGQINKDTPTVHPHKLLIRDCGEEKCDPHDVHVAEELGYIVRFQNMAIIHTAAKDVADVLFEKKKQRMLFELGLTALSPKEDKELRAEAKREAKEKQLIDLNQVVLVFEAFEIIDKNTWKKICEPVYSNIIKNSKNLSTSELKIVKLSAILARANGGEEIMILIEKANTNGIKVRFFSEEGAWESFAKFRSHYQFTLMVTVPPYKNQSIEEPVDVFIELVRENGATERSPAVEFRYMPQADIISRKRRRDAQFASGKKSLKKDFSSQSYETEPSLSPINNNNPLDEAYETEPSSIASSSSLSPINNNNPLDAAYETEPTSIASSSSLSTINNNNSLEESYETEPTSIASSSSLSPINNNNYYYYDRSSLSAPNQNDPLLSSSRRVQDHNTQQQVQNIDTIESTDFRYFPSDISNTEIKLWYDLSDIEHHIGVEVIEAKMPTDGGSYALQSNEDMISKVLCSSSNDVQAQMADEAVITGQIDRENYVFMDEESIVRLIEQQLPIERNTDFLELSNIATSNLQSDESDIGPLQSTVIWESATTQADDVQAQMEDKEIPMTQMDHEGYSMSANAYNISIERNIDNLEPSSSDMLDLETDIEHSMGVPFNFWADEFDHNLDAPSIRTLGFIGFITYSIRVGMEKFLSFFKSKKPKEN